MSTGIRAASQWLRLKVRVRKAASKLARLPIMTSCQGEPRTRLLKRQPIKRPGTAAGVRMGSKVKASDTLNCIAPKLIGANKAVKAMYKAAMTPPAVINFTVNLGFFKLITCYAPSS